MTKASPVQRWSPFLPRGFIQILSNEERQDEKPSPLKRHSFSLFIFIMIFFEGPRCCMVFAQSKNFLSAVNGM